MANVCETTIAVAGLKEGPETFVKAFSKAMFAIDLDNLEPKQWGEGHSLDGKTWYVSLVSEYRQHRYAARYCILYPHEPYNRLGVAAPRFYVETKWGPPLKEIREASKVFPDLTFHLDWWVEQDGPSGQLVIRNGENIDEICRPSSCYLFGDTILYPTISLLPAHLPYTLAQRGVLRLEDAIQAIDDLIRVLDDQRFRNSAHRRFSECRDREKTEKVRARLTGVHEFLVEQAIQIDFTDVLLEEHELPARLPRILEADKTLMEGLGLKPLLPASGEAVRLSILPFKMAVIEDPYRAIVPAVHYLDADRASGKYVKVTDGPAPPIKCEIGYLCLTTIDVRQIGMLPDTDQTLYEIDITMTDGSGGLGREFHRASNQARWKKDSALAAEVESKAAEVSNVFAAAVANMPGITIFDDFGLSRSSFPKTIK